MRWLESRVRIPAAPRGEGREVGGMHEHIIVVYHVVSVGP